jgi:hypothetical protein
MRKLAAYGALGLLVLAAAAAAFALYPGGSGARLADEAEARQLFANLHRNIDQAFGRDDESGIYDALSESVDGKLLDRIYAEVYEALVMRDQGGMLSKVREVEILGSRLLGGLPEDPDDPRFRVRATWEVTSSLVHEGHEHVRVIEYEGIYTVALREEGWRIIEDKILSQRTVPVLALPESLG